MAKAKAQKLLRETARRPVWWEGHAGDMGDLTSPMETVHSGQEVQQGQT